MHMKKYIMTIRLKEVGLKKYFEFEFGALNLVDSRVNKRTLKLL